MSGVSSHQCLNCHNFTSCLLVDAERKRTTVAKVSSVTQRQVRLTEKYSFRVSVIALYFRNMVGVSGNEFSSLHRLLFSLSPSSSLFLSPLLCLWLACVFSFFFLSFVGGSLKKPSTLRPVVFACACVRYLVMKPHAGSLIWIEREKYKKKWLTNDLCKVTTHEGNHMPHGQDDSLVAPICFVSGYCASIFFSRQVQWYIYSLLWSVFVVSLLSGRRSK